MGSADFPESKIIAEIYAQALEANGFNIRRQFGIGSRETYIPAVKDHSIDLIPEYTGNLLQYFDKETKATDPTSVELALYRELPGDLSILTPSPANDQDTVAVTDATAKKWNLKTIGDLAQHSAEVKFGGPSEFQSRAEGLPGLKANYGLDVAPANFVVDQRRRWSRDGARAGRRHRDGRGHLQHVARDSAEQAGRAGGSEEQLPGRQRRAAGRLAEDVGSAQDGAGRRQRQAHHRGAHRDEHRDVGEQRHRPRRGGEEVDSAETVSTSPFRARTRGPNVIKFDAVRKVYPDGTVAVDDLTLEVPEGTLAAFVGPSGCGKTTSMRMINRMIDPSAGKLTVDGNDVTKVDPVQLRLGIGYVIQSAGLMPHLKVIDNVATVPVLKGESRRSARKAALGVLERVGLDPKLANRYPAQLSGGQQQRVGVARALAADPPILLMDEPFSAVDPVVREELQTEILRLQSELRKTIVFVTHDIDEAIKLGEKVAVFGRGGMLQQYDAPARLLSNPANDFVAGFVGADRGYRGLQFFKATGLPLHDVRTVGEPGIDSMVLDPGEWALVTKPDGTPYAWINAGGVELHKSGSSLYDSSIAGGSLFRPSGTLRLALDAALSSPAGLGVAVDEADQVIGGVKADDVLAALEAQRTSSRGEGEG